MNWDAVGAVGEIVGACAVVGTLAYLSIQIRQASRTNQAQTFQALMDGMAGHRHVMFGTENSELLLKAFRSFDSLEPAEKLTVDNILALEFNYIEATYRNAELGLIGDDVVDVWGWYVKERLMPYAGVREWWAFSQTAFPPDMRVWVDGLISQSDETHDPYGIYK